MARKGTVRIHYCSTCKGPTKQLNNGSNSFCSQLLFACVVGFSQKIPLLKEWDCIECGESND